MTNSRLSDSIESMLANTISNENGCLIWQGSKNKAGYGYVAYGITGPKRRPHLAHRVICILSYGQPQPDEIALHSCDTPSCINPAHLRWGSYKDNVADMKIRNRIRGNKKLTDDQVIEIRRLRKQGFALSDLASRYGVCFQNISQICLNRTYRHLIQKEETN